MNNRNLKFENSICRILQTSDEWAKEYRKRYQILEKLDLKTGIIFPEELNNFKKKRLYYVFNEYSNFDQKNKDPFWYFWIGIRPYVIRGISIFRKKNEDLILHNLEECLEYENHTSFEKENYYVRLGEIESKKNNLPFFDGKAMFFIELEEAVSYSNWLTKELSLNILTNEEWGKLKKIKYN